MPKRLNAKVLWLKESFVNFNQWEGGLCRLYANERRSFCGFKEKIIDKEQNR